MLKHKSLSYLCLTRPAGWGSWIRRKSLLEMDDPSAGSSAFGSSRIHCGGRNVQIVTSHLSVCKPDKCVYKYITGWNTWPTWWHCGVCLPGSGLLLLEKPHNLSVKLVNLTSLLYLTARLQTQKSSSGGIWRAAPSLRHGSVVSKLTDLRTGPECWDINLQGGKIISMGLRLFKVLILCLIDMLTEWLEARALKACCLGLNSSSTTY